MRWCDVRVKAYIYMRSASGIVPQGRRKVTWLMPIERAGMVIGGFAEYMSQCDGHGIFFPMSTCNVCAGGSVSKYATASLATASTRSLPRMFVWALILYRVVRKPVHLLALRRLVMLLRRSIWWQ